jgi:hypothetical protein
MRFLLDTTVLSRLCYPFREENRLLMEWFEDATRDGYLLCIPEVTDYETRTCGELPISGPTRVSKVSRRGRPWMWTSFSRLTPWRFQTLPLSRTT